MNNENNKSENKSLGLKGLGMFLIWWSSQTFSSLGSSMTKYALIIWAYRQQGTALSVTMLAFCSYMPSIMLSFIAGAIADKWDKKKILLATNTFAAIGSATVFGLYLTDGLQVWHLYLVNLLLSFMSAFEGPAVLVSTSLLAPKEQYTRVSGLQNMYGSLVSIFTPIFATSIMAFAGLNAIFVIDLVTFSVAIITLVFFIKIPRIECVKTTTGQKDSFWQSCISGIKYLLAHKPIWQIILFMSFINLLAYVTGYGILPAMVLARTGDNQTVLGMVSGAMGVGMLIGSMLVTVLAPSKHRSRVIFLSLTVSFLFCDILWGFNCHPWIWIAGAFLGHLPLPFLTAALTTIMREKVPIEMHGRVFSARDTVQFITIPIGLALGGVLADYVFEPFMAGGSTFSQWLSVLVGTGHGSGMAVIFFITGLSGIISSLICLGRPVFRALDE